MVREILVRSVIDFLLLLVETDYIFDRQYKQENRKSLKRPKYKAERIFAIFLLFSSSSSSSVLLYI
jgi:hypothetical protein